MDVDLQELRALLEAATPGPWHVPETTTWEATVRATDHLNRRGWRRVGQMGSEADAAFIAAVRNALPALLDRLEAAEAKVAAVEALADELANPDATLITPIERAHRRTVSRELRDALRLKGDG